MEIFEIATGNTVDEAIDVACQKLGASREQVIPEVLELPKKVLFGLKSIPAKVKVTLMEEYVPKESKKETVKKEVTEKKEKQEIESKPSKKEAPAKKEQREEKKPVKEQKNEKSQKSEKPQKPEKPTQKEETLEKAPKEEKDLAEEVIAPETLEKKGSAAKEYVKAVLEKLGYSDAKVEYTQRDGSIVIQLSGENMGGVVGRRGDNLDALQYLASLVANRCENGYTRVVLDVDDYRSKRETSLRAYARKTAIQVARSGKSVTLEAMNPYERRIVHSTVQGVNGATSKSTGTEPNRRVVISPEGRGSRRHHSHSDRREHTGESTYTPISNEPPKDDTSSISLYGRIDL